jgi:hypothetical protein
VLGQTLDTSLGMQGGLGGLPGGVIPQSPGLLNTLGSGIATGATDVAKWAYAHPIQAASGSTSAYKLLRDQFKAPQAAAATRRADPAPLVSPFQVTKSSVLSPLDRYASIMGAGRR